MTPPRGIFNLGGYAILILALEGGGDIASVAVFDSESDTLSVRESDARGKLLRSLHTEIEHLLGGAKPDLVVVGLGPGSFTGLRIALAAAKGLAHAWSIPLVGLPSQPAAEMARAAASLSEERISADWAALAPIYDQPCYVEVGK